MNRESGQSKPSSSRLEGSTYLEQLGNCNYKVKILIGLLLTMVTVVAYWEVWHCDFVRYDDPEYFTEPVSWFRADMAGHCVGIVDISCWQLASAKTKPKSSSPIFPSKISLPDLSAFANYKTPLFVRFLNYTTFSFFA